MAFISVLMVLEHYSQWLLMNQKSMEYNTVVHFVWCCANNIGFQNDKVSIGSQPIQF